MIEAKLFSDLYSATKFFDIAVKSFFACTIVFYSSSITVITCRPVKINSHVTEIFFRVIFSILTLCSIPIFHPDDVNRYICIVISSLQFAFILFPSPFNRESHYRIPIMQLAARKVPKNRFKYSKRRIDGALSPSTARPSMITRMNAPNSARLRGRVNRTVVCSLLLRNNVTDTRSSMFTNSLLIFYLIVALHI